MKRFGLISVIVITFIVGISLAYMAIKRDSKQPLPIYNPTDLTPDVVDEELHRVGIGHKIGQFEFTNQNGKTISDKDVDGKIYVVEYFFTTCGTICPIMNDQMQRVQRAYSKNEKVKILSFTVNPEVDDVAQLKKYANEHDADDNQWWFLTGEKEKLYELARKSYFVLKPAEAANAGDAGSDFIHTNNFVLVDGNRRIRGYYDGTDKEEVSKLIEDIQSLLEE
jgi:protein SCO1